MMAAARHGVLVYLGTVVSSLIMLAAKVYIDQSMGTEVLGQYELGLSLVLLISVFALFGFHTSTARAVARHGTGAYPLMRRAYRWVILVSIAAVLLATPVLNHLYAGRVATNFALYLSLLLLAVCLLNLNMAFYQGSQRMGRVSGVMALDSVARGAAVAMALFLSLKAESLLLLVGLFALIFEILVTSRVFASIRGYHEEAMAFPDFTHLSFLIFLIAASGTISTRVSAFVIAYSLSLKELGYFAIATLFTLPLSLLGRTIETVLLPRASSSGEFELRNYALFALLLAMATVPLYYLSSGFAVRVLFGADNAEAIGVLKLLAMGYSAILVYSVFSAYIFGRAPRGYLGRLVAVTFVQSLVVVPLLNAYLVGKMGLNGAAWATNVALLIQAGLWVSAGLILHFRRAETGGLRTSA
jgi:O-antigen/teichoic acid export membrane protein